MGVQLLLGEEGHGLQVWVELLHHGEVDAQLVLCKDVLCDTKEILWGPGPTYNVAQSHVIREPELVTGLYKLAIPEDYHVK